MRITLATLLVIGCSTPGQIDDKAPERPAPPVDDGSDTLTPPVDTTTTPPTTTTPTTTESTTETTPETEPVTTPVRFVALGDAGEGNTDQFAVADAIEATCATLGCDFALYLGDNFYDTGVDGVNDDQFETKFEEPYQNLSFPFYVVMGNHDLGFDGLGLEFWKAPYYVDYTLYSTKWTMPDYHYKVEVENVALFGLNSTDIFFGLGGNQETWLLDEYANLGSHIEWKIVFAHHPYVSNGRHGNAGNYEGIPDFIPLTEIPRGEYIEEFVDNAVCGQADMYISGHDHNRQFLEPVCGTTFVVSGAGAKTTDLEGRGNVTAFEDDTTEGFLWIEIDGNRMTAKFFDKDGNEDFSASTTK